MSLSIGCYLMFVTLKITDIAICLTQPKEQSADFLYQDRDFIKTNLPRIFYSHKYFMAIALIPEIPDLSRLSIFIPLSSLL